MSSFPATDRPRGSGGGGSVPPYSGNLLRMRRIRCRLFRQLIGHVDPVEAGLFRRTQVGNLLRMCRIRCLLFRQLIGHVDPVEAGLFRRTQVGGLLRMRRIICRLFSPINSCPRPVSCPLHHSDIVCFFFNTSVLRSILLNLGLSPPTNTTAFLEKLSSSL